MSSPKKSPRPVGETRGSWRILLVEDRRENQELASRVLRRAGHHVDVAENGRIAVQRARQGRYDLILMDVDMPQMDGLEATQRIRGWERNQRGRRVPIIAFTALTSDDFHETCRACGMDDYLSKPLDKQRLLQMIDRWGVPPAEDG